LAALGTLTNPQSYSALPPAAMPGPVRAVDPELHRARVAGIALGAAAVLATVAGAYLAVQSHQDALAAQTEMWADQATAEHARALGEGRGAIGALAGAGACALAGGVLFVW
jgi:hypothetical protein